jgi:transposase
VAKPIKYVTLRVWIVYLRLAREKFPWPQYTARDLQSILHYNGIYLDPGEELEDNEEDGAEDLLED